MKKRYGFILGVVIIVSALAAWAVTYFLNSTAKTSDSRLQIVAAENVWGDIAQQIGGNEVKVNSIMSDPAIDPHMYESSSHDALLVSKARLLIVNGLGYDSFIDKLASAGVRKQRKTLSVSKVLGAKEVDANPHLWYDIERIPEVATAIEEQLVSIDPSHAASYRNNLNAFVQSLSPLQAKQDAITQQYAGTPVAYTERVPQYMLEQMKLSIKTPEQFASAIEEGNDPSPSSQNAMLSLLKNRQVKVLLYNSQAISPVTKHVRAQAQQSGIPVVGVSETMPKDTHFQAWQLSQLNAIQNALQ